MLNENMVFRKAAYYLLKQDIDIQTAFNELRLITNCSEDYLMKLKKEAETQSITLLQLINEKKYEAMYTGGNISTGQLRKLSKPTLKEIIAGWLERILNNGKNNR